MKSNWDRAAMRFKSARYVKGQQVLDVTFANGDHYLVPVESVLPQTISALPRRNGSHPATCIAPAPPPGWEKMRIGETGDVLEVPALDGLIEIPWDRVRAIADPEFRAHWADRAGERAKRIGQRMRALRQKAGVTPAALAEKVGVSREVIANLEAGKVEPQTELIEHIAMALGKRLRDLAGE